MRIRVGVIGYDLIGKRVADAVALQPDMSLEAVCEEDRGRRRMIAAKGYPVGGDDLRQFAASCDVLVNCGGGPVPEARTVIHGPQVREDGAVMFSALTDTISVFGSPTIKVPSANTLALARLLRALGEIARIERLFAGIVARAGHATSPATGCVDALEPIFDDPYRRRELETVLAPVVASFHVRSVRAPYTQSNLHTLKLDLAAPLGREQALAALSGAPRIVVGAARDGFRNTACVQEFFRDLGRSRSDRPELFVWEESVTTAGKHLHLLLDVDPEATPIPEMIDAIRISQVEGIDVNESIRRTDQALGIAESPIAAGAQ